MLEKQDLNQRSPKSQHRARMPQPEDELYSTHKARWEADSSRQAIEQMLLKSNSPVAPGAIVECNCKWYSRAEALWTLVATLSDALDFGPFRKVTVPTGPLARHRGHGRSPR